LSAGTHTIRARVVDSGGLVAENEVTVTVEATPPDDTNTPPAVAISTPASSATFAEGEPIAFAGSATDPEDGDVSAALAWTSSRDGTIGTGASFARTLSAGTHTIRARVVDSGGLAAENEVTVTVEATPPDDTNTPPAVAISTPAPGATFAEGEPIAFAGSATDPEDGDVSAALAWTSSRDGTLGTGASFARTLSAGIHTIRARVVDSGGLAAENEVTVTVEATPPLDPPDWASRDIGSVGRLGAVAIEGEVFTVDGSGADIWNRADGFHFVSRELTGNGEIVARVTSLTAVHDWAKAGVMMRESLAAGSAHAMMLVSRARGYAFQHRAAADGLSASTPGGDGAAPGWVRLVRTGDTFVAYRSADGENWAIVGSRTIAMGATVHVGLALTSHDNAALARATFDGVAVTEGDEDPGEPSAWASADIGAVGAAGSGIESGDTFAVSGAGADIWGSADAFHFMYQRWSGDGRIAARVTHVDNTHRWAKAGVMFRESLTAGSVHATMLTSSSMGMAFQRRLVGSVESLSTSGSTAGPPRWVALERSGDTFTAWESADGVTWMLVGTEVIPMGRDIYVGLAVTSHVYGTRAVGVFDSVTIE
jgi:regulation of enolase protein 1 (concanavalin A-like superfamily)